MRWRRPAVTPAWRLTLALACMHATSSMDRHVVSLVLTPLQAELGLGDTELGLLHGTAYTLLYAAAILPFGLMVDRLDRRALVAAAALLWSTGTLAFALAESFAGLFASRLLVGLGQAALVPAAISLIGDSFGPGRLGPPIGAFTAASAFGRGAALIGGGALLALLGAGTLDLGFVMVGLEPWRQTMLLSLVLNVLALAFLLTIGQPARRSRPASAGGALRWLLGNRRAVMALFAGSAAAILLIQSLAAWTPTLLVRRFALSPAEGGMLTGLVVLLGGPLGNMVGGYALDRLERWRVSAPGGRVMAISLAGAAASGPVLCLGPGLATATTGLIMAAFCLGAATPAGLAGIQGLTPATLRGRVTAGFVSGVALLSMGIGPLAVGWMSENLFPGPGSLARSLLTLIVAASALGGCAAFPWRGRRPAEAAAATDRESSPS